MWKKNFGLKNFFFSFVIVCIVIYIFQNYKGSVETIVSEKGSLEDIINAKGIIIKDEEVYSSSTSGDITYYYKDGEKVKKGTLIADVHTNSNSSQIKNQIEEIQLAIDYKINNEKLDQNKNVKTSLTNEETLEFQDILQASILNGNLDEIYDEIRQVNINSISLSNSKYDSYDIEELKSILDNLTKSLSTNNIHCYSQSSGIVTYKTDGLEDLYKYESVMDLTPSNVIQKDLIELDSSLSNEVTSGEKLYKIIRNFNYYIAATVNNEYAKNFEANKYIKTRIKYDGSANEAWGYIKKINYGSEQSVLIIYFDDYFYKVYDKRYVDLELIIDVHEGIKINSKALIEKDGLKGVYIKDASNIVKFFPVEILGQDKDVSIIYIGNYVSEDRRRVINISENSYDTIKIFDKIIIEPEKVYEGQIIE
ncbi:putative membrane fusion protein [Sedimentibacter acidaminivorans]|jgi:putative membrane fusion protein|uniref:Membrane fusion protein n=1 Tax=Sedimentibacter acidaminivorans TaxID=913099 RepID=A0ABS4GB25_9FIRM|nr:HlyD family efflux transporter periplasmic adaptor subunit [Sedimentibacter acidaminivorans]MBP1924890.1 putative membrane fusion protein [Sedimentibacter acidaminivorans]